MTGDWRIRLVGPEEAEVVLAADVFDGPAVAESTERFLGRQGAADARNILLVADLDGVAVGFASGTVLDHPDKPRALYVQELGVNDAAQRRGIGTALLTALRAEGRARGCKVSWVLTDADNDPARGLYLATGGQETREIVMFTWTEAEPD